MFNDFLSDEIIENLINDMQNDDNFMENFILYENKLNIYIDDVERIKNEYFETINNCDKSDFDNYIWYIIEPLKTYYELFENCNHKVMFNIYFPCDDDMNYIFVNDYSNGKNNILIYNSQGNCTNAQYKQKINILNINDYKTLLIIIKQKIIDLYF